MHSENQNAVIDPLVRLDNEMELFLAVLLRIWTRILVESKSGQVLTHIFENRGRATYPFRLAVGCPQTISCKKEGRRQRLPSVAGFAVMKRSSSLVSKSSVFGNRDTYTFLLFI